jgi:hypothetical protein
MTNLAILGGSGAVSSWIGDYFTSSFIDPYLENNDMDKDD